MYVRGLELKSRYFEDESKRLGMMLQCNLAENHALESSLQNSGATFAASETKQESVVLLLESLLWLLGITGMFILTLLLVVPILKVHNHLAMFIFRYTLLLSLKVVPRYKDERRMATS